MDLNDFNSNFPSFAKQQKAEQKIKQAAKTQQETLIRKAKFNEMHPNISFDNLQNQSDNYQTDDECIHYRHTVTGQIYSWNYFENEWKQHSGKYQESLRISFD